MASQGLPWPTQESVSWRGGRYAPAAGAAETSGADAGGGLEAGLPPQLTLAAIAINRRRSQHDASMLIAPPGVGTSVAHIGGPGQRTRESPRLRTNPTREAW